MTTFLQLRHHMLPYLYTMNHRSYEEDIPLILPLYYEYPEEEQAYIHGNEYYFGNITVYRDKETLPVLAKAGTILPMTDQIKNQVEKEIFEFLDQAEMSYEEKERIYNEVLKQRELPILISQLNAMEIDRDIMGVLLEILTAY